MLDRPTRVYTCFKKTCKDVVFVGCEHQSVDGNTHRPSKIAGKYVTEITRGHAERYRLFELQCRVDVINNLNHNARPIH
jgi:hypothetical protein